MLYPCGIKYYFISLMLKSLSLCHKVSLRRVSVGFILQACVFVFVLSFKGLCAVVMESR